MAIWLIPARACRAGATCLRQDCLRIIWRAAPLWVCLCSRVPAPPPERRRRDRLVEVRAQSRLPRFLTEPVLQGDLQLSIFDCDCDFLAGRESGIGKPVAVESDGWDIAFAAAMHLAPLPA